MKRTLKDKSGFGIIVDCFKDYTVNGVLFSNFFSFFSANLDISISKMREMMSEFSKTSLHFDLNE